MTPTPTSGAIASTEVDRRTIVSHDDPRSRDDLAPGCLFNTWKRARRRDYLSFFFLAPLLAALAGTSALTGCSRPAPSKSATTAPNESAAASDEAKSDALSKQTSAATSVGAREADANATVAAREPEDRGPPSPALPAVVASRFDAAFSKAHYVGSEACSECHSDQHAHYAATNHNRSLRATQVDLEPADGEFLDEGVGRVLRAFRRDGKFIHSETTNGSDAEPLTLAEYAQVLTVGSGTNAHTYLAFADGFCFESPLTWYAKRGEWRLSPGYENDNSGFSRPVYIECLSCHSGKVESLDGGRAKFAVRQLAIDCERCHGPGSEHSAYWQANAEPPPEGDATIVNPARLARREGESICSQCHFDTYAESDVRGRDYLKYLPGQAIDDYRVHYTLTGGDRDPRGEEMRIVGHAEQLHLSRCYQKSETLTCSTCHDAHAAAPADKVAAYRAKCLDCHQEETCNAPGTDRQQANDNCMVCHMPPTNTEIPHVAATHHRIGVRGRSKPPAPIGLTPLTDVSSLPQLDRDRCEGLGWLSLSLRTAEPQASESFRVRARDALENVRDQGMNDPSLDAALATIYQVENPDRAVELGQLALKSPALTPKIRLRALEAVAKAQINARRTQDALSPLGFLVGLRRQAADWYLLSVCRYQGGDIPGALAAAESAAKIRPDNLRVYQLLAELYRHNNQPERAAEVEARAAKIAAARPN